MTACIPLETTAVSAKKTKKQTRKTQSSNDKSFQQRVKQGSEDWHLPTASYDSIHFVELPRMITGYFLVRVYTIHLLEYAHTHAHVPVVLCVCIILVHMLTFCSGLRSICHPQASTTKSPGAPYNSTALLLLLFHCFLKVLQPVVRAMMHDPINPDWHP